MTAHQHPTAKPEGEGAPVATWRAIDDNGHAEVLVNGRRITSMPSYPGAQEVAERINAALSASPPVPAVAGDRQYVATVLDRWIEWCEFNEAEFTGWGEGEVPEVAETWTINAKAARALIVNDAPRYSPTPSADQSGVIGALVKALTEIGEGYARGGIEGLSDAANVASRALAAHAASIKEGK